MAATARQRTDARAFVLSFVAMALGAGGCSTLLGPAYDTNHQAAPASHGAAKSPHGGVRRDDDRQPSWLAEKSNFFAEDAENAKTSKPAHGAHESHATSAENQYAENHNADKHTSPNEKVARGEPKADAAAPLDRKEFEKYLEAVQDPALRPLLEAYWQVNGPSARPNAASNPTEEKTSAQMEAAPAVAGKSDAATATASESPKATEVVSPTEQVQQVGHVEEGEAPPAEKSAENPAAKPAESPAEEPAPLDPPPAESLTPAKPAAMEPAHEPPPKELNESTSKPIDESWRAALDRAIAALEDELSAPVGANSLGHTAADEEAGRLKTFSKSESEAQALDEARLRLLYAAADRPNDAARPVQALDASEQRFWVDALSGVGVMLDPAGHPRPDARATRALSHVRQAAFSLANGGVLEVNNFNICTKVEGFGRFTPIPKLILKPDQEVLLYVEIDNFTSNFDARTGQYETTLQGGYEVRDPSGRRVYHNTFPIEKDLCRNRRRDFYMWYRFYVPQKTPGEYTLQLTVEDLTGEKFGQTEPIKFVIDR